MNQAIRMLILVVAALIVRFLGVPFLEKGDIPHLPLITSIIILIVGIFILKKTADVIEETTHELKGRTGLAGGLLQSFGTAFPDMVIGITAAFLSLQAAATDPARAVSLAIIAAAATFGSNIYNTLYSTWCVWRQNKADACGHEIPIIPFLVRAGTAKPIRQHRVKPTTMQFDSAISVMTALTLLTTMTVVLMVLFGKQTTVPNGFSGDLYQLVQPAGTAIFFLALIVIFIFRKDHGVENPDEEVVAAEHYYARKKTMRIWGDLAIAGITILFVAESMVKAMETMSGVLSLPAVAVGLAAGIIGCFGEMLVIHKFVAHPMGRIGDAVTGVAMDNVMTIIGASIVAMIGGIFLGGSMLILIFVLILTANIVLVSQISRLKNAVVDLTPVSQRRV